MLTDNQALRIVALVSLLCVSGYISAPATIHAETTGRNTLVLGYDSFIDRYTILEDDTTEAIQEFYISLNNSITWKNRIVKLGLSNSLRYSNQTINENIITGISLGSRRSWRLELRNNLRMKFFRDGSDYEFGNDYVQSNSYMKISKYFSENLRITSKSRLESIDFDRTTDFDYNYRYIDTGVGIEIGSYFGKFLRAGASAGYREVPDTTALSYDRFLAEIELHLIPGEKSMLEFTVSGDRREYREGIRSANWIIYSYADFIFNRSGPRRFDVKIESELYLYDDPSTTFFNTHFVRAGARGSFPVGRFATFFAEPRFAGMFCEAFSEERYRESSVVLGMEVPGNEKYWLTFSYEPGYRNYVMDENEIYSDFYLNRISLMGSVTGSGGLTYNLFVTHDPERHSRRDDDFSLTLISAMISKSF